MPSTAEAITAVDSCGLRASAGVVVLPGTCNFSLQQHACKVNDLVVTSANMSWPCESQV